MAIVTISRKSGTGAKDIAGAIAKRLRYEFVSKDSIYKEIEEHGKKWLDWVARLDEHAPTLWERYDRSHAAYLALAEHCIYKNALKNNVVILGRGGNYLLENIPYSLRVRITASAEDRGRVLCGRFGIDEAAARKILKRSDHERSTYIQKAYHRQWANPDDYDMTLNSGHLGFEEMVALIVSEIPAKDSFSRRKPWRNCTGWSWHRGSRRRSSPVSPCLSAHWKSIMTERRSSFAASACLRRKRSKN